MFGSIDPATSEVGNPVAHGSTITLNYVKDESQQKTLKYTVEHKIGNTLKHSQDYTKDVWVNDPDRLTIQEGSL